MGSYHSKNQDFRIALVHYDQGRQPQKNQWLFWGFFKMKVSGSNNKERLLDEFHDKFLMWKNKTNASAMALVVLLARVVPLVIMYE